MVPAGSVLDFNVKGQTEWSQFQVFFTPTMLTGDVKTILAKTLDVVDVSVDTGNVIITGTIPWSYTATARVKTRVAHAEERDVGSIVANAFFKASGTMPSVTFKGYASDAPIPGTPKLPSLSITTAIGLAAVAILVLAWKF